MKKIIIIFIALSFLLCSCNATNSSTGSIIADGQKDISIVTDISNEEDASQKVVVILQTEKDVYSSDEEIINYTIKSTHGFGTDGYFLETKENGKWELVPVKSGKSDYNLLWQDSPTEENFSFNLKEYYDLPLKAGTYRIVNISNKDMITNEFQIID